MGLLDGGLQSIVNTAFGPIFLAAEIHVPARVDDAGGSATVNWTNHDAKAIIIDMTESQRIAQGYSEKDVQIIVLQGSTEAPGIDSDYEITAKRPGSVVGDRYRVSAPVTQDPAGATWTVRGTPL